MDERQENIAVKYFQRAILIEFLIAFLTFQTIIYLLYGNLISNFLNAIKYLGIPSLVAVYFTLVMGNWLGKNIDYPKLEGGICVFFGIILSFFLLTFGASVGIFIFWLIQEKTIISSNEFVESLFLFYLFGGLQTLIIGIVLGYKLNGIK